MAGPQDIQRYPKGLIDLLGMRATGDTPHQLAQQTSPDIDMLDFYLADRGEVLEATTPAVVALGNQSFVGARVPSGQMWLIYELSFIVPPIAAASTLDASLVLYRNSTANAFAIALGPRVTLAASTGGCDGIHFEKPLVLMPDQSIGLRASILTGAPASTPILDMWFARIGV
jgi:hypothetical protein